jgi:hypothetical protein
MNKFLVKLAAMINKKTLAYGAGVAAFTAGGMALERKWKKQRNAKKLAKFERESFIAQHGVASEDYTKNK